jgi:hypothetical protein
MRWKASFHMEAIVPWVDRRASDAHDRMVVGRFFILTLAMACGSQGIDPNTGIGIQTGEAGADPPPTPFTDPFGGANPYSKKGGGGGGGAHNAGRACGGDNNAGCHSPGGGGGDHGPALLIGGTVYQDYPPDGGITVTVDAGDAGLIQQTIAQLPAAGVEIRVLDEHGNAMSTYSSSNGTFYILASNAGAVTIPAWVGARDANTTRPMITELTGNMGNCSQSGCHVGTENGGYYRVHLP